MLLRFKSARSACFGHQGNTEGFGENVKPKRRQMKVLKRYYWCRVIRDADRDEEVSFVQV